MVFASFMFLCWLWCECAADGAGFFLIAVMLAIHIFFLLISTPSIIWHLCRSFRTYQRTSSKPRKMFLFPFQHDVQQLSHQHLGKLDRGPVWGLGKVLGSRV